jgi:hypothetical protein
MRASKNFGRIAVLVMCVTSGQLLGAPVGKTAGSSGGGKSGGRDWLLTLPLMAGGSLHAEYNAGSTMGLALEYSAIGAVEELLPEDVQETGNSLTIDGIQVSALMSRYSDERNMGGFFWTLGAGYRVWNAEWKKRPGEKEAMRLTLVDQDGYLHHRVQGKGVTGHGRLGYRFVASQWPLAIGAHLGIRHMNSQVRDSDVPAKEQEELQLTYSDITEKERTHLKNRMMTRADISLDFGFAF